jgi:preprotein translocase subunit SecD
VALLIYALVTFAIFKNPWAPVTLTLAGIAGFILSIGMAVDANVLIFERMKEELRGGRTLGSAIEAGFARAWSSIWDSNLTTIISCAILFWFGTGLIRGFALTLAIGVVVSLFSSITVTRTFLRTLVGTGLGRHLWWFGVDEPRPSPAAVNGPIAATGVGRLHRPAGV